ncbi:CocE/NonD family hydrolase [Niveispirillum sp. KHB5.9]|uniref:CocE/NonD family hydrolase n=1 Tax=Niveispirillum sp. KHB5.9 TaxID=3400269 RepID=UPI003A89E03C
MSGRLRNAIIAGVAGGALLGIAVPDAKPDGWSDQSYYLSMRDGVRLALSLYYPDGTPPAGKAPVLLVQTRYGRAGVYLSNPDYGRWRKAGYVVAIIDTRGSTASFGSRLVDIGPDEQADMAEIIAHLATRPWSSGEVFTHGVSYMADTADWSTASPAPALKGAMPRQTDFDAYLHLFMPGGVSNDWFLSEWGGFTQRIDTGRAGREDWDCVADLADCPKLFPALQPVDGDDGYRLMRQAVTGRERWAPGDYMDAPFRDDPGRNGHSLFNSSPASALDAIRQQRKPVQYWGSWVDGGTAEAALARYRSAPDVPMEVWITANSHQHDVGADPFLPERREPLPDMEMQFAQNLAFTEKVRQGGKPDRMIHYYVMGTGRFRDTDIWPPAGTRETNFHLAPGGALSATPAPSGSIAHKVDFTATTGDATRWSTQFGTPPAYPDRRAEGEKLLSFNSPPFEADMELAGTPSVTLHVASATADPAFFAYLEDVAPDGRVTYLTEGMLRAVHRKPADPASLPYDQGSAPHSFRRADALQVIPGEAMEVRFALFPTAALIKRGHRLRLSIAGGDAKIFRRYSEGKEEVFTVQTGPANASRVTVDLRPWRD